MPIKKKLAAGTFAFALSAASLLGSTVSAAGAETKQEDYIVVFKNSNSLPSGYENVLAKAGGEVKTKLGKLGSVEVSSANPNFLNEVKKSSIVLDVDVEKVVYPETPAVAAESGTEGVGGDADLYNERQWDIKQVTGNGASWELPGGTGKSVDGQDIVVAVVDTGIDYNHPDLKENYAYGKSFVPGYPDAMDENSHGTHVAGAIAANGRTLGVGPDLKVAAYRVFGPTGGASTAHIAEALKTAADDNVDVINMSLGGYDWLQDPEQETSDIAADMRLFNRAIQYAIQQGVTVVGSAGNNGLDITSPGKLSGDDVGATHRSPSSQTLIRVSAGGANKNLAFYSNYGVGKIDVMAPGGDLGPNYDQTTGLGRDNSYLAYSTIPGGGYGYKGGTSMAAPKVAGLAGVIIAQHGKDKLNPAQVKHIIQSSSEDIFKKGYDKQSGFGLIDAVDALN
ncbi:S8 family serine peptidase [Planomicrobium sp. CPCC 101079]|uniref:S8 family peptidase n=1 Tax=Planomicrobium sp. CPCC 101079 TaxID=2599618 RepID=UPI0011B42CBC|nr:S8 family serine peptidase [Planomicrobium sp. CPCC 101079]TWT13132.1 S8 family serine peptidase [Planomicrobium sp. CPCC 101079]